MKLEEEELKFLELFFRTGILHVISVSNLPSTFNP